MGGGDWADASVEHIEIDDNISLDKCKEDWRVWYNNEYLPEYRADKKPKFYTFVDFLKEHHGAINSTIIEEYWDE